MNSIVVVAGATATGKSALAVALAKRFDGEVVNADSQQVYRGLDIGTGKPTADERAGVPHHLFDLVAPWEQLDAARFASLADEVIAEIASRGRRVFVVGGTGLWLRALLKGLVDAPGRDDAIRSRLEGEARSLGLKTLHARLAEVDPITAAKVHATDPVRVIRALEVYESGGIPLGELHRRHALGGPRYRALPLALDVPREQLDERIRRRSRQMFEQGLVAETRLALADERARPRVERVMGYREALAVIEGRMSEDEAIAATATAQRQYSKRQGTWFRGEDEWTWLRPDVLPEGAANRVEGFFAGTELSKASAPR